MQLLPFNSNENGNFSYEMPYETFEKRSIHYTPLAIYKKGGTPAKNNAIAANHGHGEKEKKMPPVNVKMNVRRVDATTSIIDIVGEITAFAENALMDAYITASTPTTRTIIMNFGGLDYMNSSGIGVLVTLLIRMNRQRQRMLCYGLSEHYQTIFAITRLNDAIKNYATEADALAAK